MKELKYNNEINIKVSKKMASAFQSEKVLREIMSGKNAHYKNYNEFVLFLIDSYCEHRREWFQIPEVQEYVFAKAGGYENNTTRHYRDKIKKYIKHLVSQL
jgi:hypothetical protein